MLESRISAVAVYQNALTRLSQTRSDLQVLWHLAFAPIRGDSHAERLESFYQHQAGLYDRFRERLLAGRQELYASLPVPEQGTWVDLGGGTGSNAEYLGARLPRLERLWIVDLSASLLEVARQRAAARHWSNVELCQEDACSWTPPCEKVDVVTFSYSLTMMPDWLAAIDHAYDLLKPGGTIGVVDFYVSRKFPRPNHVRHSWSTRTFWSTWFGLDNVFLSPDHLAYLERRFECVNLAERRAPVPYLVGAKAPYYLFQGRKPL